MQFTAGHAWLREENNGNVWIGISDFAESSLGDVVFVSLPPVGARFEAGDEIVVIESVKAADGIVMPMTGEIIAVNESLLIAPEKVNELEQADRWFVIIKPDHPGLPADLMDEAAYLKFID